MTADSFLCGIEIRCEPQWAATAAIFSRQEIAKPMHYILTLRAGAADGEVWAALRFFGRDGLSALVGRTCGLAHYLPLG